MGRRASLPLPRTGSIRQAPLPPGELLTIGTVTFRAVYELQDDINPPKGPAAQPKSGSKPSSSVETLRAGPKSPARPPAEDDVEFDFEKPLVSLDEIDTPAHSTRRLETPTPTAPAKPPAKGAPEKKAPAAKPAVNNSAAQPAKPVKPAPAPSKAAPAKPGRGDAATIDFKKQKNGDDEEEHVASSSDDDLDDFLKSLEK